MTKEPVIHTERLGKSYGRVEAVKELNLSVRPSSITAFLGLNGAGKSTTIKMLLGMMRPSSGDGAILGQRISDPIESVRARTKIAYVSENKRLYDYMTVDQMIRFTRAFYPDWRPEEERKLLCPRYIALRGSPGVPQSQPDRVPRLVHPELTTPVDARRLSIVQASFAFL